MATFLPHLLKYAMDHSIEIILFMIASYALYRFISEKFQKNLPPGPMGLPFVGCLPLLGDKPYKKIAGMRKKYGDIIGLKLGTQYTVVLNEHNILKEALYNPATLDRQQQVMDNFPLGFGVRNGAEWHEQRKFCLHVMRNLGLGKGPWYTLTKESTRSFIEKLHSLEGQPIEVIELLDETLTNNIMSLIIGRRLDSLKEKKEIKKLTKFASAMEYFGPFVAGSLIPGYRKFCEYFRISGYDQAAETVTQFFKLSKKEVQSSRAHAGNGDSENFISLYDQKTNEMQTGSIPNFFSEENLLGNMAVLFLGGNDTVSTSLAWLFRLMAKYPEIQEKVHAELDDVIGSDGDIRYEERQRIPYTFAVMQEAQRVSSILPLTSMRSVSYDFELGGYTIPKGSMIIGNTWGVHNDPNVWKNPEEFQPERFLKKDENAAKIITFSLGKRNCPGETVAWMVMLTFFSTVMQKFTISVPSTVKIHFEVSGGLVEHLKPQPLYFTKRA